MLAESQANVEQLIAAREEALKASDGQAREIGTLTARLREAESLNQKTREELKVLASRHEKVAAELEAARQSSEEKDRQLAAAQAELQQVQSRLVEVSQSVEDRDAQIASFDDHIASVGELVIPRCNRS